MDAWAAKKIEAKQKTVPFVYMLECSDGTFYTGWAVDLARRLAAHNAGQGARYTKGRRPVRLAYQEVADSPSRARLREAALRRLKRKDKIALCERGTKNG